MTRFFNPTKKKSVRWRHSQSKKFGVNRHLLFCQFPKNPEVYRVGCLLFIKPWHHTLHSSEFFGHWQNRRCLFTPIDDYLSYIQRKTKAFLLIVRHNTEGQPFSDWQWGHRTLIFFVGVNNRVNLVLFFKLYMRWLRRR